MDATVQAVLGTSATSFQTGTYSVLGVILPIAFGIGITLFLVKGGWRWLKSFAFHR